MSSVAPTLEMKTSSLSFSAHALEMPVGHHTMLNEAFANIRAGKSNIQVVTREDHSVNLKKDLLLLFSPFLRSLLSSLPPSSSPLLILPSSSLPSLLALETLLATGTVARTDNTEELQSLAMALGIPIKNISTVAKTDGEETFQAGTGTGMEMGGEIRKGMGLGKDTGMGTLRRNGTGRPPGVTLTPLVQIEEEEEEVLLPNSVLAYKELSTQLPNPASTYNELSIRLISPPALPDETSHVSPNPAVSQRDPSPLGAPRTPAPKIIDPGSAPISRLSELHSPKPSSPIAKVLDWNGSNSTQKIIETKTFISPITKSKSDVSSAFQSPSTPDSKDATFSGFTCNLSEKCRHKVFPDINKLRRHYSMHYQKSLEKTLSTDNNMKSAALCNQCYLCQKFMENKMSLLNHLGSHHKKIDRIVLEDKGINLEKFEPQGSSKHHVLPQTPKSDEKKDDCNFDQKCEVCGRVFDNISSLEGHVTYHFTKELYKRYAHLADGNTCRICCKQYTKTYRLFNHIGGKHGKVNELLLEKGMKVLPCPLSGSSSAQFNKIQEQLEEIKVETSQSSENVNEGDVETFPDLDKSEEAKEGPLNIQPLASSTMQKILKKYNL